MRVWEASGKEDLLESGNGRGKGWGGPAIVAAANRPEKEIGRCQFVVGPVTFGKLLGYTDRGR